jgi:hypothetical protein
MACGQDREVSRLQTGMQQDEVGPRSEGMDD